MYSPLLHWASLNEHKSEYHTIMRLFQDHAEENVSFAPGDAIVSPMTRRTVHTLPTVVSGCPGLRYDVTDRLDERTVELSASASAKAALKTHDLIVPQTAGWKDRLCCRLYQRGSP
ncbi:hypothetical protein CUJ84_Chr003627 [Rhizobium leguminosarum]|uniref:Uncharacterized protein n=1 Tax=Rhizobium leguminosarum TaxID=384 RepID=A0A2K9Z6U6_RHILE|nr:hypothetical protein CUJ84_Chr003627 [Rhizobium leguminosarum]